MRSYRTMVMNDKLIAQAQKNKKVLEGFFPLAKDKTMFARQQKLRKGILENYGIFISS